MIDTDVPELSKREVECMKWVAAGKTDWETAQILGISRSTAHFHVERVKKKLRKSSRTEAVAILVLHGLI
jgi:DNA-binding CsgD family transcriptional regulator